jgi:hypothetical protein
MGFIAQSVGSEPNSEWVARWLRAVEGKFAALIARLTLCDPGQPFATVLDGHQDCLLRSQSPLGRLPRLARRWTEAQPRFLTCSVSTHAIGR